MQIPSNCRFGAFFSPLGDEHSSPVRVGVRMRAKCYQTCVHMPWRGAEVCFPLCRCFPNSGAHPCVYLGWLCARDRSASLLLAKAKTPALGGGGTSTLLAAVKCRHPGGAGSSPAARARPENGCCKRITTPFRELNHNSALTQLHLVRRKGQAGLALAAFQ